MAGIGGMNPDVGVTDLPSGQFSLIYDHSAFLNRARGNNAAYSPATDMTYRGLISDDQGFREWVKALLDTRFVDTR